jgi:ribosomal protein S18 acetylase RimI-like enzyme
MTDHDHAAARREIADALQKALDRRHEVLDAIVEAGDRAAAVEAIAALLDTSPKGGEAVMTISFDQLTRDSRRKIAEELEDLNKQLTFTLGERPASSGESLSLRVFSSDTDRDLFVARTSDVGATGDGSGAPAGSIDDEISAALGRVSNEEAVWFVAEEGADKVGMVFGELVGGEVNVRVWIHPDHRHRGFGTAALRRCRSEMAAYFPAVPMVVRAPGVTPK